MFYNKLYDGYLDTSIQVNKKHVGECLQETLKQIYSATMVKISEDQQQLFVTIDLETFVCLLFREKEILFFYFCFIGS